jgi:hypothetical protein
VTRYLPPHLRAMNLCSTTLDGGVNDAPNLDSHGKALAFLLLDPRSGCGGTPGDPPAATLTDHL